MTRNTALYLLFLAVVIPGLLFLFFVGLDAHFREKDEREKQELISQAPFASPRAVASTSTACTVVDSVLPMDKKAYLEEIADLRKQLEECRTGVSTR